MSNDEIYGWGCPCGCGCQLTIEDAAKGCPADHPAPCGGELVPRVERACRLSEDECARRCSDKPGACDLYGAGLEADGLGCRVAGRALIDGVVILDLQPEVKPVLRLPRPDSPDRERYVMPNPDALAGAFDRAYGDVWQGKEAPDMLCGQAARHLAGPAADCEGRFMSAPTEAPPWETCSAIADRWEQVTVARVARVVILLGLGSSRRHTGERDGLPTFSPAAVGLIERELRSRGYRRAPLDPDA